MMKPHDQLTIVRNLHRARELRQFRDLVETYFERSERDVNDTPMDWEGARAARSQINRMLPRVLQIVRAAGLGGWAGRVATTTDPGIPSPGRVEVLHRIFSARLGDGLDQEIIDVLDMALGVYEGSRVMALGRTINPLYYGAQFLAFLGRAPRRILGGLGLGRTPRAPGSGAADSADLAARLVQAEDLMESRLAEMLDRQALRHSEYAREVAELAERLDFAERMLAKQDPHKRLPSPETSRVRTPV